LTSGALRLRRLEVRSKLFVPGARPELFTKAAAGQADALSFDLEDSVLLAGKQTARRAVAQYLAEHGPANRKVKIVRVNALASGLFSADVEQVLVPGLDVINLPKVESRDDVLLAVNALENGERQAGLTEPVGILANIETPKGLRLAFEIATAHPRVIGLQIGMVDLSLACGFATGSRAAVNAVRLAARFAASEAGIAVFDGAFTKVNQPEEFRAEAEEARSLGLNGKSCIHPSQVPIANTVFSPSDKEIEQAERLVAAAQAAHAEGVGAFLVDGSMIDAPVLERAHGVLARAALRASHQQTEIA
jgi:citrate lyase subunit beta/citryl-CoA lyase